MNMGAGSYVGITDPGDNILFWTDDVTGFNVSSGLVIASYNGASEGIRISNDGLSVNTPNGSQALTAPYAFYVDGSSNFTKDIRVNGITVGLGGGNVVQNTVVGEAALQKNVAGTCNTAIGYTALQNIIGVSSVGNGVGRENTAVGHQALLSNTYGNANTAVGVLALEQTNGTFGTTLGSLNTAVGDTVLTNNTTGSNNTAIGADALFYTVDKSYNTAIGNQAGNANTNPNSDHCTFIGADSGHSNNFGINTFSTALGYGATISTSNQIVLGRSSEGVSVPGNYLNIGGTYNNLSGYALEVDGSANFTGQAYAVSFNNTSDYRIKENVTPLDTTFVVDNLNPVKYTNTKTQRQDVGFIAHELQEVYPFLVNGTKDGEQFQSVNYIGLIGILTKEIQEIKERIKILEEK
jgi:hypothetical protein